jgi:hypothetical protein
MTHRRTTTDTLASIEASYRAGLARDIDLSTEDRNRFARVATARMAELEGIRVSFDFWMPQREVAS